MKTLRTQNEGWGFYGTMGKDANKAWPLALKYITEATGESHESVRAFLDSVHGRHFADDVRSYMHLGHTLDMSVQLSTNKWMAWTITRNTSRHYGIPKGLPYLTGFVIQCAIYEEESA